MDSQRRPCGQHEPPEQLADQQHQRLGSGDCERLHAGCVAQPVNAATSLGYVVAGAVVLARAARPRSAGAISYAAWLALVGLGSIAYHGPQPRRGEFMHDLPIIVLLAQIGVTPVVRLLRGMPVVPGCSRHRGATLAVLAAASGVAYAGGRTNAPTCDPDSLLQLHGLWHLMSGAAFVVGGDMLFRQSGVRT